MDEQKDAQEAWLAGQLKSGDIGAFKAIYRAQFPLLFRFAYGIVRNKATAEEIAQETLTHLWEIRDSLTISFSLHSYLLKAVRNSCIDHLRHQEVVARHVRQEHKQLLLSEDNTAEFVLFSQLQDALQQALANLPEEYAVAFRLNRFQAKSYQEIAEQSGVSVRTVEYRISKAVGLLRQQLAQYLQDED